MPILAPNPSNPPITAQDVFNCTTQDVRQVLGSQASDNAILIDYTNRVQLSMLRASRWQFLRSDVNFFITAREQTQYWIGPAGAAPPGIVDTGLDLADVDVIQRDTMVDVSHGKSLNFISESPFANTLSTQDAQFRPGPPAEWRQDEFQPNIISLYPAPDNASLYQPIPQTPYCTTVAGGALPLRTYFVLATFVDSLGNEGTASAREQQVTVPAGYLLVVNSPELPFNVTSSGVTYNQYNVYASAVTQSETLQTVTPIAIGTDWTEPTSGLTTSGAGQPTQNKLTVMDGYLITFRYYKTRMVVQNLTDELQIPYIYKDIVCAGVNWYATQYLRIKDEAQLWMAIWKDGLREIVKDQNLHPKENDYIYPDRSSLGIGNSVPYVDTYDFFA